MSLLEAGQELAADLALWLGALDDPEMPLAEMGTLSLELSVGLRGLAILALLAKGDVDKFHHNLIRSARCRLAFIERVHREKDFSQHDFVLGCVQPLLDAMAANDIALAQRISALSPSAFRPGHEYEDDFCFAKILQHFVGAPGDNPAAVGWLDRWRAIGGDARADVCDALLRRDQAGFESAFEELLVARTAEIAASEARGELESPGVLAQRKIDVDALALLRLAQDAGLRTEPEYRYCPALARRAMSSPFPD